MGLGQTVVEGDGLASGVLGAIAGEVRRQRAPDYQQVVGVGETGKGRGVVGVLGDGLLEIADGAVERSEERRVGKECRL